MGCGMCDEDEAPYIEEGQGNCQNGAWEIYRSNAWELASSSGGEKDFSTSEYMAWCEEALELCIRINPMVTFVSVWTDAGYRCYTGGTCSPNGADNVKSWKRVQATCTEE